MEEKILIIALTIVFLAGFIKRNVAVQKRTGKPVRSKDILVFGVVSLSTLLFILLDFSVFSEKFYAWLIPISILRNMYVLFFGYLLFTIAIILGWVASAQMKDSWRVGVIENDDTELIKDGFYRYIRNPYFLFYFFLYFSFFLIRPSAALLVFICLTIGVIHKMVLKEENFLEKIHGAEYLEYKQATGRYFIKLFN